MSDRRHKHRSPEGARRGRRRAAAPEPLKPKRWRGPLVGGLAAVPVGLGLAAALVVLSGPDTNGFAGTEADAGSTLPDDSGFPDDDFFAAPDDPSPDTPSPGSPDAEERGAPATGSDSVLPPSSSSSDDSGDSDSDSDSGSGEVPEGAGGSDGSAETTAEAVVELVNEERADAGCDPVRIDADLTAAAEKHSADMAARDYMAHESPEGTTPAERAAREGYDVLTAENVAAGQASPEAVMESWMNSDGHRANILDCDNKAIGVGEQDNRWTQKFGAD
ncbi:CAP domain-containing protein [Allosalinactinospora lopnorensis]|uniref:CAP domain-containing protein n=1 Tax=Allosalinactinospora lopnorensis TaxID=1352348 RepID=UPI000623D84F|nr:CAP domain-containing protein [Allosalinactinospora lopnorensis]